MHLTCRFLSALMLTSVVSALGACSAGQRPLAPIGRCNATGAQALIGKSRPTVEEAKRLTGASIVRDIAPGDPVIHNYSHARVTFETDPVSGFVVNATCG